MLVRMAAICGSTQNPAVSVTPSIAPTSTSRAPNPGGRGPTTFIRINVDSRVRAGRVRHDVKPPQHLADQRRGQRLPGSGVGASSTAKADGATTLPIVMRPPTQITRATTYTYRSAIMPIIIVVWPRT